jgi:phage terminase large subunit-like protein
MPSLAAALADSLETDRRNTLRPSQRPPPGDWWSHWLLLAGRGFGKGQAGASFVLDEVEAGRAGHVALVAPTASDVKATVLEGPSGILRLASD